ncbi:hypothetical protein JCM19236_6361 [Vibrio sp. JCM 19236]|nr:hypothetical protein JCM19236_6361 [Vibrio sp. JCM 19236]
MKAVSISGKAEAEWTSEEKKEAEQIKKEVNEVTHTTGGKITVPAHFCLYGLIRDGQSSPSGYSVEPSK